MPRRGEMTWGEITLGGMPRGEIPGKISDCGGGGGGGCTGGDAQ